jgi:hypothetical protein
VGGAIVTAGLAIAGGCLRSRAARNAEDPPMSAAPPSFRNCPLALVDAREGGLAPDRYVVPSDEERAVMRDVLSSLSGAADVSPFARARAAQIGFEIVAVAEIPGTVLVRERVTDKRGGGAYVVRLGAGSRVVVQAPHTFFDEGTLPLACDLFGRTRARALFVETAHRYRSAPAQAASERDGAHPADVAHAPFSLFQAATEGVLRASDLDGGRRAIVVQLHGFAPREGGFAVVVSSGERRRDVPIVHRAADALGRVVPGAVLRFPDDVDDLGATTNVQGIFVRSAGGEFLHVEIAAPMRRDLVTDADLRARVLGALASVLEGS